MRKIQVGQLSLVGKKLGEYDSFSLRFQAVVDALMVSFGAFSQWSKA
jgi:hypothetical protein